ncbi:MAG: DUF3343 domain-containing protein [Treponema sp.]|nr:DUF3343 domain-containing protein [Treponema sp.]
MKVEAIVCFESTSEAIMAEQALADRAVPVRVMPKPAAIEAGCGFCLRFSPDDLERVAALLLECGIKVKATYRMEEAEGGCSYRQVSVEGAPG